MTNRIKNAFDGIRAEDKLKSDTVSFLKKQLRVKNKRFSPVRKIAAVMACLIIAAAGIYSTHNLYFSESVFIDLDVNPSIEFTVNRFDRVIGAYAYNQDGSEILSGIKIMHKNYRDAVESAIDEMAEKGFITNDALISITLQTGDEKKDTQMLANIETAVRSHRVEAQVDAFSVDSNTRTAAHDLNLSPAKYLAILKLQEVDPTATIESCRGHSIGELYKLAQEHSANHHNTASAPEPQESADTSEHTGTNADIPSGHNSEKESGSNGHHGKGGGHGKGKN